ncbi:MAG: flippase-like domain-containing protein [Actinobacteria bacterium]|nr:flippase-like domain-containing protein [Actinomycetota bacterium]
MAGRVQGDLGAPARTRRRLRAQLVGWAGVLLSALFAYLAVRDVDLDALGEALKRQEYVYLLPSAAFLAVGVLLRVWRWQLLFERDSRPRLQLVGSALLIGYLFNTILPARAGELARVQALGRRTGISRAHVLGTVMLERAFDLVVLVALLLVAAPFLPPVDWLSAAIALGAVAAAALVVAALVVRRYGVRAARVLLRPLAWLPGIGAERVERIAGDLVTGMAGITASRLTLRAIAVTALSWLVLSVSVWLLLLGTDLDAGFGMALLVLVATNLVLVLPSSPAALGAFEAAVVVSLAAYGVDRAEALSFALVLHALNALPYILLGYLALAQHARAVRT